jgi:hypothetical protein
MQILYFKQLYLAQIISFNYIDGDKVKLPLWLIENQPMKTYRGIYL